MMLLPDDAVNQLIPLLQLHHLHPRVVVAVAGFLLEREAAARRLLVAIEREALQQCIKNKFTICKRN